MKRTISHEAQCAVARLRDLGFTPARAPPSRGGPSPFAALGLREGAGWSEVRQAFVERVRQCPPERHPEDFIHIVDAYDTLKRAFRDMAARTNGTPLAGDGGATGSADEGQPAKRRRGLEATGGDHSPLDSSPAACGSVFAPGAHPVIALDMTGVAYMGAPGGSPHHHSPHHHSPAAVATAAGGGSPVHHGPPALGAAVQSGGGSHVGFCGAGFGGATNGLGLGFGAYGGGPLAATPPALHTLGGPIRCGGPFDGGGDAPMCIG